MSFSNRTTHSGDVGTHRSYGLAPNSVVVEAEMMRYSSSVVRS